MALQKNKSDKCQRQRHTMQVSATYTPIAFYIYRREFSKLLFCA